MYKGAWRNPGHFSRDIYCNHCKPDELKNTNNKLYQIIMKHGSAFDEEWYYWLTKTERYIRRIPLWLASTGQLDIPTEKPKRFEPNKKLVNYT